ncbi:MAG: glycosyltransferase [Myxococcota bacterium]|nr:glycosyltransferase [Myxococcota bacterium]
MFWLSVLGLSILLLIWSKGLVDVLCGATYPAQWRLADSTAFDADGDDWPLVSILIPARNEAENIERCIRSIMRLNWPEPLQIIVINDNSTDNTGEILERLGHEIDTLTIIEGVALPDGWLGKPHALHVGQQAALGRWLWFIDADVVVKPNGLRLLYEATQREGAQISSALGQLDTQSFWERVIQTRIAALISGANPLIQVNDPDHERALANGQCIFVSRSAYDQLGGHYAIRQSVLDDVDLAKRAKQRQIPYRLFYGPGIFRCRMYTGFRQIWDGWSKNLFPALEYKISATIIIAAGVFCISVLPFLLLFKNLWAYWIGAPFEPTFLMIEAALCGVILITDAIGHYKEGYRWTYAWSLPLAMTLVIGMFVNSAWRIVSGRGTAWKGRIVSTRSTQHDRTADD